MSLYKRAYLILVSKINLACLLTYGFLKLVNLILCSASSTIPLLLTYSNSMILFILDTTTSNYYFRIE